MAESGVSTDRPGEPWPQQLLESPWLLAGAALLYFTYPMAYGFLLILYGPVHHFLVIPLGIRWRRGSDGPTTVGRRLPTAGLALFPVAVVVLGTAPAGPVVFDFESSLEGSSADLNPTCSVRSRRPMGGRTSTVT